MKVTFKYSRPHDIWCILNYGKGSRNSDSPTKTYAELVKQHGEDLKEEHVDLYIENYIKENSVHITNHVHSFQLDWDLISDDFQKRAEKIFGIKLQNDVNAYLSI